MGIVVLEGLIILLLVATGSAPGRVPRGPAASSRRPSASASACSSRSSASSTPASCGSPPAWRPPSSSASAARSAAGRCSCSSSACSSPSSSWSARSTAPSSSRSCPPPSSRSSSRSIGDLGSQVRRQPRRLVAGRPALAVRRHLRDARLLAGRPVLAVRLDQVHRHRRRDPAGLLAPARRLLRHDGHDGRRRWRGRPARQGRHPAQRDPHPRRRLASPRPPVAPAASRRTPPTSSPRPASATAPAPVWPRWSPAWRSSSRRSCRPWSSWSRSRPPPRPWSSSASSWSRRSPGINWRNYEVAIPAFLTIILMPFTYSITVGIGAGIIMFVVIKLAVGKIREIHAVHVDHVGPVRRLLPARPDQGLAGHLAGWPPTRRTRCGVRLPSTRAART